jgi:hypothetical protein
MSYGVMIPVAIAATNVDAWNRSCICSTSILENGGIVALLAKSATAGESELWTASIPTSSGTSDLPYDWMVYDPELVWTGSYRGLDPDVRNYVIAENQTFSAFKPQLHDLILMDADCFTASRVANTFAGSVSGQVQLVWNATQVASALALHYLATQYISIGTGAMDTQRIDAYLMEVIPQT